MCNDNRMYNKTLNPLRLPKVPLHDEKEGAPNLYAKKRLIKIIIKRLTI